MKPGDLFGRWVVVSTDVPSKNRRTRVFVRCECGHEAIVNAYQMKQGKSLGCLTCMFNERRTRFVPGQRVGGWVVVTGEVLQHKTVRYGKLMLCECACGHREELGWSAVLSGTSAGCSQCTSGSLLPIGHRHGEWTVVSHLRHVKTRTGYVLMKCACGSQRQMPASAVKQMKGTRCRHCNLAKKTAAVDWVMVRHMAAVEKHAEKRKIPFSLGVDDVKRQMELQGGLCALTGVSISVGRQTVVNGRTKVVGKTASLDRIDSDGGYEVGNIQWVLAEINLMKGTLQQDRFVELCRSVADHFRSN